MPWFHHPGLKPWKCSQCHKSYTNAKSLRMHEDSHQGKTYACQVSYSDYQKSRFMWNFACKSSIPRTLNLGLEPILCVCVCVTINSMLKLTLMLTQTLTQTPRVNKTLRFISFLHHAFDLILAMWQSVRLEELASRPYETMSEIRAREIPRMPHLWKEILDEK